MSVLKASNFLNQAQTLLAKILCTFYLLIMESFVVMESIRMGCIFHWNYLSAALVDHDNLGCDKFATYWKITRMSDEENALFTLFLK